MTPGIETRNDAVMRAQSAALNTYAQQVANPLGFRVVVSESDTAFTVHLVKASRTSGEVDALSATIASYAANELPGRRVEVEGCDSFDAR